MFPWRTLSRLIASLISTVHTWTAKQTFSDVDINGGDVDGVDQGQAVPGLGTFTTLGSTQLANHTIYVDGGRADTYTADGTMLLPYKTILAALTAINADAAAHAAAGHYELTNYIVRVAAGTYSDALTINNEKYLRIEGAGVFITGTIALTQTQQTGDYYSRLEFVGVAGTRAEKGPGLKLAGAITGTRNNDSLTYVAFKGCWITGNLLFDTDGTWVLHFNNSRVAGTIDTGTFVDADSAVLIETTGWNEFAGAITDKVSLYNVDNAEFYGAINITPIFDSRVTNTRFGAAVTINAKNLVIDAKSYASLVAQTETLAGCTVVPLDGWLLNATTLSTLKDIEVGATNATYYGDSATNGSWRIIRDGDNLAHQRRESDAWVTKSEYVP